MSIGLSKEGQDSRASDNNLCGETKVTQACRLTAIGHKINTALGHQYKSTTWTNRSLRTIASAPTLVQGGCALQLVQSGDRNPPSSELLRPLFVELQWTKSKRGVADFYLRPIAVQYGETRERSQASLSCPNLTCSKRPASAVVAIAALRGCRVQPVKLLYQNPSCRRSRLDRAIRFRRVRPPHLVHGALLPLCMNHVLPDRSPGCQGDRRRRARTDPTMARMANSPRDGARPSEPQ